MRKSTIAPLWLGGLVAIIIGLVAAGIGTGLIFAYGGTYNGGPSGQDFVPTLDAYFWWMVALASAGGLVALVGGLAQLVAWIGALVNTVRWAEKTWFIVLLVGGLLGVVGLLIAPFAVMIAYLIAAPDEAALELRPTAPAPSPATAAPAH